MIFRVYVNLLEGKANHNWLVVDQPLWKMMEFVTWDDDIPNIWKNKNKNKKHQPGL